jgi:hypothetical protein
MTDSQRTKAIQRREFLKSSGLIALLGTISIKVIGCDGEKDTVVSVKAREAPATTAPQETDSGETEERRRARDTSPSEMETPEEPMEEPSPPRPPPRPQPPPNPGPVPNPGPPPATCQTVSGDSTNDFGHTHPYSLSGDAQEAGSAVSLLLQCAAGHKHTVSLSGAEVTSICDGSMVVKESTFDAGHTHSVMFNV